MKTEAVENEVLNFISLQPLFHYGGAPPYICFKIKHCCNKNNILL